MRTMNYKKTITILWGHFGKQKLGVIISFLASFISSGSIVVGAYRLKPIINDYIAVADWDGLMKQLIKLGIIYGVGILASLLQTQVMLRVAYKTLQSIRKDLFSKIQHLPIEFTDNRSHGEVMSLFTNDIDVLQITLEQSAIMVINNSLQLAGTFVVMTILSPKLVIVTIVMSIIMFYLTQKLTKLSHKYFVKQQNDVAELEGMIEEKINGIDTIKVFHHEKETKNSFASINTDYQTSSKKALTLAGIILPIVNQLNSINLAFTAVFGGFLVLNGHLDIGGLSAYIQMTITYNQPFKMISMQVNNVLAGLAGASRIFSVIEKREEQNEGTIGLIRQRINDQSKLTWNTPNEMEIKGHVIFENVSFAYKMPNFILKDINLTVNPGEKVAFVGSTGAGKTTIINLVTRFYETQEGQILIDGKNIKDIEITDLRKLIGIVLQDTHLFTGTIAENIRYGKPDAKEEEIIEVAKLSRADHFIQQLPEGYQTKLYNDGENISKGQRQLIAIARTAIANPNILILDEATSSVDTRTEAFVNEGMNALMEGRTVLIIAHRLSTVKHADNIIVLDHGQIIEKGSHENLLRQKGHYYRLNNGAVSLE